MTPVDPAYEARVRASFGRPRKPGRTLTAARAEVYSADGKHVASMQQTLMMLADTPDTRE